jgi:lipopolysaccharide/colanic/teichoic acid biosynthesis glycosyltransferase
MVNDTSDEHLSAWPRLKRLFDFAVSLTSLLLLLPCLVIIGAAITLGSGWPVLYRGLRVGRNGVKFRIIKFRSMVVNAEKIGGSATSDNDPRLTPVGKILRKYKLDELPQLINVLYGEMSLVGPRPEVPSDAEKLNADERRIFRITPGITDWASLWDFDEGGTLSKHDDPEQAYNRLILPTKRKLQLMYVHSYSFIVDLKILAYTLCKLLNPKWVPRELKHLGKPGEHLTERG